MLLLTPLSLIRPTHTPILPLLTPSYTFIPPLTLTQPLTLLLNTLSGPGAIRDNIRVFDRKNRYRRGALGRLVQQSPSRDRRLAQ